MNADEDNQANDVNGDEQQRDSQGTGARPAPQGAEPQPEPSDMGTPPPDVTEAPPQEYLVTNETARHIALE